jgi:hypothetical protein
LQWIQSEQYPWYWRKWWAFSSFMISTCELSLNRLYHSPHLHNVSTRTNKASPRILKRPSLLRHPKNGSFKTTVTQTLTTVRGMKITPLLRYPHHHNLA